jgi:hypothetical protein
MLKDMEHSIHGRWNDHEVCCRLYTSRPTILTESKAQEAPTLLASEKADPQSLASLYHHIYAENKTLKLELASLRYLVNEILMEIRKPTPTVPQPGIQIPKAAPAPPSQQQTEKRKRMSSGASSPYLAATIPKCS